MELQDMQARISDYGFVSIVITWRDSEGEPWVSTFNDAQKALDFWNKAQKMLKPFWEDAIMGIDSGAINSDSYLDCLEVEYIEHLIGEMEDRGLVYDEIESYDTHLRFFAEPPAGTMVFNNWHEVAEWLEGVIVE